MQAIKRLGKWLLVLVLLAAIGFFVAVYLPLSLPQAAARPELLLLTNTRLVNVVTGVVEERQSILIRGDEILAVGPDLASERAQVIDAGGRYAIPGLFDMHVHSMTLSPWFMHPLFIAAGVTAVRDMGGCIDLPDPWVACLDEKRRWHRQAASGERVSPRYDQLTSLAINGGSEIPGAADPALGGATPGGARQRVAMDAARGVDFLKPYSMLPADSFFALAEAANQQQLYLAGHLPFAVPALDAVAAGQRSIEHAFLFIWDCYPGIDSLRTGSVREAYSHELREKMIAEHDATSCARLHQAMRAAGTALVPTHTTRKLDAYAKDEPFRNDERLRYIPGPLRTLWLQDADGMAARTSTEGLASYRAFYEFGIEQTGVAHRAGVTILAGTDAPDSFAFPGFALHDELEHLQQAGLSPLDALRAATIEPARFLGLEGRAGNIIPGARADLVLLNENPLVDISAVRSIDTVVLAGAPYDRSALDGLQVGAERAARHWSMWPKFLWQVLRSPIMRKQFAD